MVSAHANDATRRTASAAASTFLDVLNVFAFMLDVFGPDQC